MISSGIDWRGYSCFLPILGSLFFCLFINDIPDSIRHILHHTLADDVQVYKSFILRSIIQINVDLRERSGRISCIWMLRRPKLWIMRFVYGIRRIHSASSFMDRFIGFPLCLLYKLIRTGTHRYLCFIEPINWLSSATLLHNITERVSGWNSLPDSVRNLSWIF